MNKKNDIIKSFTIYNLYYIIKECNMYYINDIYFSTEIRHYAENANVRKLMFY